MYCVFRLSISSIIFGTLYAFFFLQDEVVLDCRFATEESTKDYFFEKKKKKKRALLLWIARWKLSGNFLNFLFGWLIAKPEIMS